MRYSKALLIHMIKKFHSVFVVKSFLSGAFQIVAGWWGHQPGQTAVVVPINIGITDHSFKTRATIWNAPFLSAAFLALLATIFFSSCKVYKPAYYFKDIKR